MKGMLASTSTLSSLFVVGLSCVSLYYLHQSQVAQEEVFKHMERSERVGRIPFVAEAQADLDFNAGLQRNLQVAPPIQKTDCATLVSVPPIGQDTNIDAGKLPAEKNTESDLKIFAASYNAQMQKRILEAVPSPRPENTNTKN